MYRSRLLRQFLLVSLALLVVVAIRNWYLFRLLGGSADPALVSLYLWTTSVLVLLAALGGAVWIVRGVSVRLGRVLQAIEAIRKGEYPRLRVDGADEIAALYRGINKTVEELQNRDARLKSWASQTESELVTLSRTLEEEREKLGTVLDSIGDGVIVLDSDGRVLMANWRVAEMFGVPIDTVKRARLDELLAQVRHRLVQPEEVERKLAELQTNPYYVDEITLQLDTPNGELIRLYCAPVQGSDGKLLGRIATALDAGKDREVDRLKTEFLSTISHELRTPLTSIKGALGLIRGGAAGSMTPDMRELLDIAMANTDRLVLVINNMLDIVQLERGQARMRQMAVSLNDSAVRSLKAVAGQAAQRNVTVEVQLPDSLPEVQGDPRRVDQVIVNLLSNAVKFSHPGRSVLVSGKLEGRVVTLSVQDFGMGMSKEFQGRLFSKFEHEQTALTRESQGAGLGLAICKHIMDAHGGRIWVESEEGVGSTFHVSFPAVETALAHEEPEVQGRARRASPRLILVIDDDPDVARVISYVFEAQGHRVISATSGREGVELARKHHPDMLTLDLIMPDMDGYQVLKLLRGDETTRNIPIICISVQPDTNAVLAQGANYCLEKPLDLDKLRETCGRALAAAAGA